MPEENSNNNAESLREPDLLWDCFVNWALTLEKLEKEKSN